jgi:putative iron-regulated protein
MKLNLRKVGPVAVMTAVCAAMLVAACGGGGSDEDSGTAAPAAAVSTASVVKTNADIAYAVYKDSLDTAKALKVAIDAFVAAPTPDTFLAAKAAWRAAREPYGQSEVFRFRLGPIDSTDGINEDGPEGRINAWPLGEALIDYVAAQVDGDAGPEATPPSVSSNIISDQANVPTIDRAALLALNEDGGDERNVATGYHAIEFLLWGQDLNQGTTTWNGSAQRDATPGQRPLSDFYVSNACTSGVGNLQQPVICQRRGQYLQAAVNLLIEDLEQVVAAWSPNTAGNHYAAFVAGGNVSLAKMLEAMGRLGYGELAGERINIALTQDSQEDEHSCFSDNTHRDIVLNAQGIQNTYLGSYKRVDGSTVSGVGVDEYLRAKGQSALADQLLASLQTTASATLVIDTRAKAGMPFDQQIQQDGINSPTIKAAIAALVAQTQSIGDVIRALGLSAGDLCQDTAEAIGSCTK